MLSSAATPTLPAEGDKKRKRPDHSQANEATKPPVLRRASGEEAQPDPELNGVGESGFFAAAVATKEGLEWTDEELNLAMDRAEQEEGAVLTNEVILQMERWEQTLKPGHNVWVANECSRDFPGSKNGEALLKYCSMSNNGLNWTLDEEDHLKNPQPTEQDYRQLGPALKSPPSNTKDGEIETRSFAARPSTVPESCHEKMTTSPSSSTSLVQRNDHPKVASKSTLAAMKEDQGEKFLPPSLPPDVADSEQEETTAPNSPSVRSIDGTMAQSIVQWPHQMKILHPLEQAKTSRKIMTTHEIEARRQSQHDFSNDEGFKFCKDVGDVLGNLGHCSEPNFGSELEDQPEGLIPRQLQGQLDEGQLDDTIPIHVDEKKPAARNEHQDEKESPQLNESFTEPINQQQPKPSPVSENQPDIIADGKNLNVMKQPVKQKSHAMMLWTGVRGWLLLLASLAIFIALCPVLGRNSQMTLGSILKPVLPPFFLSSTREESDDEGAVFGWCNNSEGSIPCSCHFRFSVMQLLEYMETPMYWAMFVMFSTIFFILRVILYIWVIFQWFPLTSILFCVMLAVCRYQRWQAKHRTW